MLQVIFVLFVAACEGQGRRDFVQGRWDARRAFTDKAFRLDPERARRRAASGWYRRGWDDWMNEATLRCGPGRYLSRRSGTCVQAERAAANEDRSFFGVAGSGITLQGHYAFDCDIDSCPRGFHLSRRFCRCIGGPATRVVGF